MTNAISTSSTQNYSTTNNESLIEAAISGNLDVVKSVMEQEADLHIDYGRALIAAAEYGKLKIVKYLVEFKANFLPEEIHNGAPIYKALGNREDNSDANNALIQAATKGQFNVVKYLIEQGVDVHVYGDLAVNRACGGGYLNIVKYLVEEAGADLHGLNSVMSLPFAVFCGHFELVKYLVEQGADLRAKDELAFEWAIKYDHFKIVEYLLEQADITIESNKDITLLTHSQRLQMITNYFKNGAIIHKDGDPIDFKPVIKLFTPDANCIWLLSELNLNGIAFGLCDLGLGFPELGYVSLAELQTIRGQLGLPVERDEGFIADKTLSQYAQLARKEEKIIA